MQTINLQEDNPGGNLDGRGFGDGVLDTIQKARSVKEIRDRVYLIKI